MDRKRKNGIGFIVEKREYAGCPAFKFDKVDELL